MEKLNDDLNNNWKALYEEEHLKNADLAGRIADLHRRTICNLSWIVSKIINCGKPLPL